MNHDVFYFPQQELEKSLGSELYEKHKNIRPLLLLIQYRLKTLFGEYHAKRLRIFEFDNYISNIPTFLLNKGLSFFGYNNFNPDSRYILLSDTFVSNPRYSDAYNWLSTNEDIAIINQKIVTRENFINKIKDKNSNNFVFSRDSVIGKKLALAILNYQDYVFSGLSDTKKLSDLLSTLEFQYKLQKKRLKRLLRKGKITGFITINQYNAADLIICDACNELEIITKQIEHHTYKYSDFDVSVNKPMRLTFVNKHLVWDENDIVINDNSYKILPAFNQSVEFIVAGCIELIRDTIDNYNSKKEYINLMLSDIPTQDSKVEDQIIIWRNTLFAELYRLSKKTNIPVRVRYKPGSTLYREHDAKLIEKYNFLVSESTAKTLYPDILCSKLVISTPSSIVELCGYLGVKVCTIDYPLLPADNPDGIEMVPNIPLNEVSNIELTMIKNKSKAAYFNFDILTEV